jgi:hypothetical protein
VQYIDKLTELKQMGEPVIWRFKEIGMREEWTRAVVGTVANYRNAAENPGDKYGHIAADKRAKISAACNELEKWLAEKKAAQEKIPKGEKPVLLCAEMEKKNQELSKMANDILKEPKPPPPKPPPREEKKEEKKEAPKEENKEPTSPKDPTSPNRSEGSGPANMDVD